MVDRLVLEMEEEGDGCIITMDINRILIPKGIDNNGRYHSHLRIKLLEKLHTVQLSIVRSFEDSQWRYHWSYMYDEVKKKCEKDTICKQNQMNNPEEPLMEEHDLTVRPMELLLWRKTWTIFMDFSLGNH